MKKNILKALVVSMTAVSATLIFGSSIAKLSGLFPVSGAVSVSAASVSGNYEYTILDDGTVEISKYNGLESSVTIPGTIDGKTVTGIGVGAFSYDYDNSITSVTIPDSVTSIKDSAFESCTALTNVNIPGKIKTIEYAVFKDCESLKSITIPYGVTEIGYAAFSGSGIESLVIPDSVTVIGEEAFSFSALSKVTLSKNLKEIKPWAFKGSDITDIEIPEGITSIQHAVFDYCKNLTHVSLPDTLTEIEWEAFKDCTFLDNVTIPDGVKKIGESVFERCSSLKNVTLPNAITEVPARMFYECLHIEKIVIPGTVTKIGDHAFNQCYKLTDITMPDNLESIGIGAFYQCVDLSELMLADTVEYVGSSAFAETDILNIHCPGRLKTVGKNPFADTPYARNNINIYNNGLYWGNCLVWYNIDSGSVNIKNGTEIIAFNTFANFYFTGNLILPDGIKTIGDGAFMGNNFEEIVMPDSVTYIGEGAFASCYNLKKVTLSKNIGSLEYLTFSHCYELSDVTIPDSVKYVAPLAFFDTAILKNQKTGIKYVSNWIVEADNVPAELTIRDGVVGIAENVFFGRVITGITIPKSVKYIAPHSINYTVRGLKMYCYSGSAAEEYAKKNNIAYELLDVSGNGNKLQEDVTQAADNGSGKNAAKTSDGSDSIFENGKKVSVDIRLSAGSYTYNGKVRTPRVVVKDSTGKTLKLKTDYTVIYAKGRKKVGRYAVTVKFRGNYSGKVKKTFTIRPKLTGSIKLVPGRKRLTVKWKKQTTRTMGYQIQYSTSSGFKGALTVNVTGNKITGKTISGLKAKRNYYVRIRTYKTVKGNTKTAKIYSSWGKVQSVKVK